MPNYEIKIKIDIKKTDKKQSDSINKVPDGSFGIVIPHDVAENIDQSEKALLAVNYPAIRNALSQHLSDMSKDKALNHSVGILKKT
jgi:hypothetical protein